MNLQQLRRQFSRYALVGILNFAISTGVLNLLMWATQVYKGRFVILYTAIGFTAAVTNSFFWNKRWTFNAKSGTKKTIPLFYTLTVIGACISSAIVYVITTHIPPPLDLTEPIWANIANIISVGFSVLWNFTAYSQVVFRTPATSAAD